MSAFAYDVTSSDVVNNSSVVNNLISLAMNYDSFLFSDFVIYNQGVSTVLVWSSDLNYDSNLLSSDSVEYVSAAEDGTGNYIYDSGEIEFFQIVINNTVVSNLEGLGFKSNLYSQFYNYGLLKLFGIFAMSCLLVITLVNLRKGSST